VLKREAMALSQILGCPLDPLIFGLHDRPAFPANQKLDSVWMVGMVARDKRSLAIQPVHQTRLNQEVQAAIDARGRDGSILWPNEIKQFIGRERASCR
jgi:hypothetical protein